MLTFLTLEIDALTFYKNSNSLESCQREMKTIANLKKGPGVDGLVDHEVDGDAAQQHRKCRDPHQSIKYLSVKTELLSRTLIYLNSNNLLKLFQYFS